MLFWSLRPSAKRILRTRDRKAALWTPSILFPSACSEGYGHTGLGARERTVASTTPPPSHGHSDFWPCRVSAANNRDPPWGPDSAPHFGVTRKPPGEGWLHQALPPEHTVIYSQKTDMDCEPSGLPALPPLDWLNAFHTTQHHCQTSNQLLCKSKVYTPQDARSSHEP